MWRIRAPRFHHAVRGNGHRHRGEHHSNACHAPLGDFPRRPAGPVRHSACGYFLHHILGDVGKHPCSRLLQGIVCQVGVPGTAFDLAVLEQPADHRQGLNPSARLPTSARVKRLDARRPRGIKRGMVLQPTSRSPEPLCRVASLACLLSVVLMHCRSHFGLGIASNLSGPVALRSPARLRFGTTVWTAGAT